MTRAEGRRKREHIVYPKPLGSGKQKPTRYWVFVPTWTPHFHVHKAKYVTRFGFSLLNRRP